MIPEISVILPTFNRAKSPAHFSYLRMCVMTLQHQKCDVPFEILIGTELPQDNWSNYGDYFSRLVASDDRFKLVLQRHVPSTGHGPTDNDLHRLAQGTYCTRPLGDDELFEPDFLQSLYSALQTRPDAVLAYGDFYDINCAGNVTAERKRGEHSLERLQRECYIGICAMYKKQAWEDAGGYQAMLAAEDYDMWLRMARLGPFVHVPRFLGSWRDWHGNLTSGVRAGTIEQGKIYEAP